MRRILIPALLAIAPLTNAVEDGISQTQMRLRPTFWQRIFSYEPTYFALEPGIADRPVNAKFQISFTFLLIGDPEHPRVDTDVRPDGLMVAYTQTSFWDLETYSKPFYDSSYKPQAFWHQGINSGWLGSRFTAVEFGMGHESNGQDGTDSRSQNHAFVRPLIGWEVNSIPIRIEPRFILYVGDINESDLEDNPDLADYRGHVELTTLIGRDDGWHLRTQIRFADHLGNSSLQVDLSHPLDEWTAGWMHGYAYLQTYVGYSESLLDYNEKTEQPRVLLGFAITN